MAIQQPISVKQYNLQNEVASRVILLTRDVVDNNGTVDTVFGCTIHPKSITYEVDANGVKMNIYESSEVDSIIVSQEQLMSLFGIKVTLADGTVSYIGEILSNFADQIISTSIPDLGTITTQNINIQAVLEAQQG